VEGDDKCGEAPPGLLMGTGVTLAFVLCFLVRSALTFSSSSEEAHEVIESRLS